MELSLRKYGESAHTLQILQTEKHKRRQNGPILPRSEKYYNIVRPVTSPLASSNLAAATARQGGALDQAYDRKMRDTADACRQQGLVFLPIALETLGGMHHQAISQFKRLGAAMARHTGSDEREIVSQLVQRISLHLMRGNAAMITSRRPDVDFLPPEIDGVE